MLKFITLIEQNCQVVHAAVVITVRRSIKLSRMKRIKLTYARTCASLLFHHIQVRETITKGLENTGAAFVSMMNGGNIGKQLVHVADV